MKITQILISFLIFNSCSSLQNLDALEGYKGFPTEVESTSFKVTYVDGVPQEELHEMSIHYFDYKGYKTKHFTFNADGSRRGLRWAYSYDKFGNQTQTIAYNEDNSINFKINSKYNKYGRPIKMKYVKGGKGSKTKYQYDRKNKIEKIIGKYGDGSFKENTISKYDEKWRETEVISYDESGRQESRIECEYDKNGNQIINRWYNANDILHAYYHSTYNSMNDRTRVEQYSIKNGKPELVNESNIEYTYDAKENCVEERHILNGKTSWVVKYKINYPR